MTDLAERVAGAPITWGICEVPGWGYQMPPARVLSEMRSLGLRATELGPEGFLPHGSERALLESHGLSLVAGFVPVVLHDPSSLAHELARVDAAADTISALGGRVLVLAASTGEEGYEETGRLDTAGWAALGRGIDDFSWPCTRTTGRSWSVRRTSSVCLTSPTSACVSTPVT